MKKLITIILLSLSAFAQAVSVEISNLGGEKGQVFLAVYDSPEAFPDQAARALVKVVEPLGGGDSVTTLKLDLKPGRYAIATFLDRNKNGKLDTNIVGAPKERFGFSKNPRILTGAPNFSECAFEVTAAGGTQKIRLQKLF
jgi:uncharacterized protein (DUF2141 family)